MEIAELYDRDGKLLERREYETEQAMRIDAWRGRWVRFSHTGNVSKFIKEDDDGAA